MAVSSNRKKKWTLKNWLKLFLTVFVIWLIYFAISNNLIRLPGHDYSSQPVLYGPYKCRYVIDGDTIVVRINDEDVKVRLLGIDTPESVAEDDYDKQNCEEGRIASEYTKNLLTNKPIYLEYDVEKTDFYGRTLAYVYLDDKNTMVNRKLIEIGYAQVFMMSPNVKYAKEFNNLQKQAQKEKKGFWNGYFDK